MYRFVIYLFIAFVIIPPILFISCSPPPNNLIKERQSHSNPLLYQFNEIIAFNNIQEGDIKDATIQRLKEANTLLLEITTISIEERNFENTLLILDNLYNSVYKIWNIIELLGSTHPSFGIQEEAFENELVIQNYMSNLSKNKKLYSSILSYSTTEDAKKLKGGRRLFLENELNSFQQNGLNLSNEYKEVLKNLEIKVSKLSSMFVANINSYSDTLFLTEEMLIGLPGDYIKARQYTGDLYAIDLTSPSYFPFMMYSESDSLRKILQKKYLNIGMPQNIGILNEIIIHRTRIAEILDYSNYAEYILEDNMAMDAETVWIFLKFLNRQAQAKSKADFNEMLQVKQNIRGEHTDIINEWEKYYLENQILKEKYNIDSEVVKEYFELNNVINGLFTITQHLFSIQFNEIKNPSVWHKDVKMYKMIDIVTDRVLGYFYLDLFPRKRKYTGAAEYSIISGKSIDIGYQKPMASLVCNFSPPSQDIPSLLLHEEVETLFHEFGHLLHELLTTAELVSQSGTTVAMDFVEMPSQIFENWAWNKEALNTFAKHYQTGELIPEDLLDRMIAAKNLQSGNNLLQQIFYASLDLTYFDGFVPIDYNSTTEVVKKLQNLITPYSFNPGTHQQASFDHLIDYGTSYYGYLWSEVYAQDMYSIFESEGILNSNIGNRFRKIIFEPGSSIEPMLLIKEFLGRAPKNKPFLIRQGI